MNKKEDFFCIVDFVIQADLRGKIKEGENRDKCLNLARVLRKLWNMNLTVKPIVIDPLRTVPKGLEREQKGVEHWRTNQIHLNYSIIEIGQIF